MTREAWWMRLFKAPRSFYAVGVTVIAAIVLITSAPRDVVPGDPAALMAMHANLDVFAPLSHNLWGWMASLFSFLPAGSVGFRWNLFSALCGAACCGMLVLLGARLPKLNPQWSLMIISSRTMANLAGTVAGLLLLGALPFRIASAIASPVTFELLALLVAIWLIVVYCELKSLRHAAAACMLVSIAASQSAIAIAAAPFFLFALLYAAWLNHHANFKTVAWLLVLIVVPGLFVIAAVTTWFSVHPSADWTGLTNPAKILYQIFLEIYLELRLGAPLLALILVGIYCVLPFAMILSLTSGRRQGALLVFPLMVILGALVFLNFRFAPFPLIGMKPFIIAAYAITALWFAYLAAYLIGTTHAATLSYYYLQRNQRIARGLATGGFIALMLFIGFAGAMSHQRVQVNAAMSLPRLAESIANQADDNTWLVLYGELDPLVRIKAHELGRNPLIISAHRMSHRPYQRALAAAMPSPRLASMAETDLAPLLRERFHPDHAPAPRLAMLGDPGLLRYIVNTAWPDRVLYWNAEPAGLDPASHIAHQRSWWRELSLAASSTPYRELESNLRTMTSRIANDSGIWFEDHDDDDFAREAYREAIRIDPENLCARLNLRELLDDENPDLEKINADIETLSARYRGRLTLARLMDKHGTIRHAAAAEAMDRRWNRASNNNQLDPRLVKLFENTDDDAIVAALNRLTESDPVVLLNFARLANGRQRPALASKILETLPATGPLTKSIRIERAQVAMLLGDRDTARKILASIPAHELDDPRALIMLALITLEDEPSECDRYLAQLEAFPGRLPDLSLPIASIYEARGNRESAARHLAYLAARQPLSSEVHRKLIRLYIEDDDYAAAFAAARPLLALDTRDPLANAALALHLDQIGQPEAAAEARKIAVQTDPNLHKILK